jgi:hypothetical protein
MSLIASKLKRRGCTDEGSIALRGDLWSSPRKMESRLRVVRVVRALELLRGHLPQGGVPAGAVVERLDVLKDARLRLLPCGVAPLVDQRGWVPFSHPRPATLTDTVCRAAREKCVWTGPWSVVGWPEERGRGVRPRRRGRAERCARRSPRPTLRSRGSQRAPVRHATQLALVDVISAPKITPQIRFGLSDDARYSAGSGPVCRGR